MVYLDAHTHPSRILETEMNHPHQATEKGTSSIPARAILIGLLLIPINAYWITVVSELWATMIGMTATTLFFNAVFNLFFLTLINIPLRKFLPKAAFSRTELLTVYIMLVMLSTICGHTMMTFVIGTLTRPFWFATAENEYADLFHGYIPSWFTVSDKRVLRGFFEGGETFHTAEHFTTWLTPVLVWTGIIFAIFFSFICVNIIIRRQWTEQDKLSYPIIRVPIALTTPRTMSRPLLWIGFSVSALIEILNGLHHLFPIIPGIPLHHAMLFSEKPWHALGWMRFSFSPFVIGLTFFAPLDLAFSVWFFYLFFKAQQVIAYMQSASLPFFTHGVYGTDQGLGAWTTLGILSLWITRRHFNRVLKRLLGRTTLDDSTEPLSYRFAMLGLVVSMAFLVILLYKAGLSLSVMPFYFAIYLLMSIAITRVRAALGPPFHEVVFTHPQGFMVNVVGTRALGASNLTILSFLYPFNRDNSSHPMPSQLEAFKIAERTGINNRHLLSGMVLALVISILASFWAYFQIMYEYGAAAKARGYILGIGRETFRQLTSWLQYPKQPDYTAMLFIGLGAAFSVFLMAMQRRFIWWPFHPGGYALGASWGMVHVWASVLVGWAIKGIILKYGGLRAYRNSAPFFLGLILGDHIVSCTWSIIGAVFRVPTYT